MNQDFNLSLINNIRELDIKLGETIKNILDKIYSLLDMIFMNCTFQGPNMYYALRYI